ncbi:hypothetical protein AMECASPLE_026984 [Ameca splendens]|uniref:Uncharacterized protein n=1 Tax=Ameca splendens TaxID=208324 RepID=A0ABV0YHB5_9TELE
MKQQSGADQGCRSGEQTCMAPTCPSVSAATRPAFASVRQVSYATIFTVPSASYMRSAPHHSGYLGIINFEPVAPRNNTPLTASLPD